MSVNRPYRPGMDYDFDIAEFVNRYIAVWKEPDPDVRHNLIAALWDDEAVEFTDSAEYRGLPAIEAESPKPTSTW